MKKLFIAILFLLVLSAPISSYSLTIEEYNKLNEEQQKWYNIGHDDGYEIGYDAGYEDCYYGEDGYDHGYKDGYEIGCEEGEEQGETNTRFAFAGAIAFIGIIYFIYYLKGK